MILGGIVGMGVDAATGSTLEHYPNPVFVTLDPLGRTPARKKPAPKAEAEKPQS